MTENEKRLIHLLYSVEDCLDIYVDNYCNFDHGVKKPMIEQSWINERNKLIEEIENDTN